MSPFKLKWILNLYPPLFLQGTRVTRLDKDLRYCEVQVRRRLWTKNLNGTTFGGTIFAAADPVYPLLYWQLFARRGEKLQVWLKGATIDYQKPAATTLTLKFELGDADLEAALADLDARGKSIREHRIEAVDASGEICAVVNSLVYMRRLRQGQQEVSGF